MGKHAAISSESAGDVISRRVLWNAIVRPHGAYKFVWRGIILSFCRTTVSVRPGKRFAVVQDVGKKLLVVARRQTPFERVGERRWTVSERKRDRQIGNDWKPDGWRKQKPARDCTPVMAYEDAFPAAMMLQKCNHISSDVMAE